MRVYMNILVRNSEVTTSTLAWIITVKYFHCTDFTVFNTVVPWNMNNVLRVHDDVTSRIL